MDKYEFIPQGVCASKIVIYYEDDIIKKIETTGGCPGNGLGLAAMCEGEKISHVVDRLSGIKCGFKNTSCPDQIAQALKKIQK